MRGLFLSLLLLAAASPAVRGAPAGPSRTARELLKDMERLTREASAMHPVDARGTDRELKAAAEDLRAKGRKAVPLLMWYLGAKDRPLRVRTYAAAVLGMIKDPIALRALKDRVTDAEDDAGLRSAALQSVASLGIAPHILRPILDDAAGPRMPEPVLREAYAQLAWIGTADIPRAEKAAKRHGPRPEGARRGTVAHAVEALGRSPSPDAHAALFRLLRYYKKRSPAREAVVSSLTRRYLGPDARKRPKKMRRREIDALSGLVFEEPRRTAIGAARLLGALGDRRAVGALSRALRRSEDPAVVAEAAAALAAIGDPRGGEALARLHEGLIRDRRFRPEPGRDDPGRHALRIQEAMELFRGRVPEAPPEELAKAPSVPDDPPPPRRPAPHAAPAPPKEPPSAPPVEPPAGAEKGFRFEGWPGSGRPKLAWSGGVLPLRESPSRKARIVASARPKPGEPLVFDETLVITLAPGRVRARRDAEIDARLLGPVTSVARRVYKGPAVRRMLRFRDGDTLETLAYLAAGECFVRREGTVYLAPCPQDDRASFGVLEELKSEWWLRTTIKRRSGWFHSEQEGLEFLPRW